MTAESLNLVGDGDETDLIEALEAAFGITLRREDPADWRTLGDAARTFEALAPPGCMDDDAWAIQRAFYQIRDAAGIDRVRPSTPLATFAEPPKRFIRRIRRETGLRMPALLSTQAGKAATCLCVAAFVGLAIGWLFRIWPAIGASVAVAALTLAWLAVFERGAFPPSIVTVGDLARRAAPLNLGALRREGAGRGLAAWDIVAAVAAEESGIEVGRLSPETLLFPAR